MLKISYLELGSMVMFGVLIALVTTGLWLNVFSIIGLISGFVALCFILFDNNHNI